MLKIIEKIELCSFCDEQADYLVVHTGLGLKWCFLCEMHRFEYAAKRLKF